MNEGPGELRVCEAHFVLHDKEKFAKRAFSCWEQGKIS